MALGGFPALPWVRSSLGRKSEGRRVLGLLLTPRVPYSPLPPGILQKANFCFKNKDYNGACSPIFPSRQDSFLPCAPPLLLLTAAFLHFQRVKSLISLFSPIFIKAVVDFSGKLILEHPRTHPHSTQTLPMVPSSHLHFGVHCCCYKDNIFLGGRGEGKGNEVFFFLLLGFLLILPSVGGGRVLIAFCHATQHSVIQAKNFG